jgi:hypothetical protein
MSLETSTILSLTARDGRPPQSQQRQFQQALQHINTYWLASLAPEASTRNLPHNVSALLSGDTEQQEHGSFFTFAAKGTNAIISHLEGVYYCNRG